MGFTVNSCGSVLGWGDDIASINWDVRGQWHCFCKPMCWGERQYLDSVLGSKQNLETHWCGLASAHSHLPLGMCIMDPGH